MLTQLSYHTVFNAKSFVFIRNEERNDKHNAKIAD